ncbi:helix-turn-helix domain-containing protein [Jiangella rhizosphaerae]|nr:helix-turn-helix domain-containing protein [Jiangella rhizosphaerae]
MPTKRPEARREQVRDLRDQGLSFREIGRRLGISHEMARRDARDAGLTALTPVPSGLSARGEAFWAHAIAVFELDAHEQELLTQVCRLLDRADALRDAVEQDGVIVTTPRGDRRPNPAIAEERQVSLAIGRLLVLLEIPADDGAVSTPTRTRARRAAEARWQGGA